MKKLFALAFLALIIFIGIYFTYSLKAPDNSAKQEIVIINSESPDAAALELEDKGFIKSFNAFNFAYKFKGNKKIEPGGYYLSKNMNALKVIDELNKGADLKSITIPEGIRKEQIGERLQKLLGWSDEELDQWNSLYSDSNTDYKEGVYFPDTYLIPVNETPTQVANRMIGNFNDKFAPYFDKFAEKNIKWTTALKIASLIEREAAGEHDMKLISGVMWNRLNNGERLDIDATIQYAIGKRNGQWWSRVTGEDIRDTNSPYNTYKIKGLPPTPIANPGLTSIEAVLNPEETDCYFYLHDRSRQIHCSVTYEEHLENIDKYLN
jgi:UPF0755 protein